MSSRIALLLVISLVVAPALCAQQAKPKPQKPLDPRDVEALTGRPYPAAQAESPQPVNPPQKPAQAAKARPPMDWRDVDILTGRAEREARERRSYAQPYYLDASAYDAELAGAGYSRLDRGAAWRFSRRGFGRGAHSDFLFFQPRFLGPTVFFPRRTFHGSIFIHR